jgi:hypothetical protein
MGRGVSEGMGNRSRECMGRGVREKKRYERREEMRKAHQMIREDGVEEITG